MENFSDRNNKIVTGIKNFFKGIQKWAKENKALATTIVIALVVCIAAIFVVRFFVARETTETNMLTEAAQEVLGEEEVQVNEIVEVALEQDAYPELNQFFATYYIGLASGEKDVISASRTTLDDLEWMKILKKSDFVESYQNLECYTKPGPYENTYVCYVYYEIKFHDLDVLVPGLSTMYVLKDGDNLVIEFSDLEEEEETYLISISKQEDVLDLFRKVQVDYNDLVASDANVELFLTELPDLIKVEVAKELALMNATEEEEAATNEEETTEDTGEETETVEASESDATTDATEEEPVEAVEERVKATTTVNVRMSDSVESDKVGKVQNGEELIRLEEMNNGWSKIVFDDQEAYIKSEYLESMEVVEHEPGVAEAGTMVTTTDNVNIRSEASINSEVAGAALAGAEFELIEHLESGWSKIKFNGGEAYIKSDYLE